MGINLALIGKDLPAVEYEYNWRDVVTYALGVGAKRDELDFLFEQAGPRVLPTFAVVPSFGVLAAVAGQLKVDLMKILHGEQQVILHSAIPPKGKLQTVGRVEGIYDKGKGALAVVRASTRDASGELLFENIFSLFCRGYGGFGGESGPAAADATPPDRAPDMEISYHTSREQHLLYRLNGDFNPLHASPQFAKMAGFEEPILHGLCTYGHAGRALVHGLCGGDPTRLERFAARFTGVVFPGDTLTTRAWQLEPGRYAVEVDAGRGKPVLAQSLAHVKTE